MKSYTLYLDESETNKTNIVHAYAIGGVIIEDSYHETHIKPQLTLIKQKIWNDFPDFSNIILHEKEVKDATEHRVEKSSIKPEYIRFYNNINNAGTLYKELSILLRSSDITTLGCIAVEERLHNNFPDNLTNSYSSICMQMIIENFCHFLFHNNAIGNIIYESRESSQNIEMSQHFHQIKAIGTMYVNSKSIQKYIRNIDFPSKQENIAGLQLADFIPNQIAKKSIGKKIYANAKDFNANIYRKTYDGACNNKNRFGIRVIPKD